VSQNPREELHGKDFWARSGTLGKGMSEWYIIFHLLDGAVGKSNGQAFPVLAVPRRIKNITSLNGHQGYKAYVSHWPIQMERLRLLPFS